MAFNFRSEMYMKILSMMTEPKTWEIFCKLKRQISLLYKIWSLDNKQEDVACDLLSKAKDGFRSFQAVIVKGMGEDIQALPWKKEGQKIHWISKECRPLEEHTWESCSLAVWELFQILLERYSSEDVVGSHSIRKSLENLVLSTKEDDLWHIEFLQFCHPSLSVVKKDN